MWNNPPTSRRQSHHSSSAFIETTRARLGHPAKAGPFTPFIPFSCPYQSCSNPDTVTDDGPIETSRIDLFLRGHSVHDLPNPTALIVGQIERPVRPLGQTDGAMLGALGRDHAAGET